MAGVRYDQSAPTIIEAMQRAISFLSLVSGLLIAQSQHSTAAERTQPSWPSGVIWGAASTNGIKAGLKNTHLMCFLYVETISTRFLVLPVDTQRLGLTLKHADGAEVPRTSAGKNMGKPLAVDRELKIEQDAKPWPSGFRGVVYRTRCLSTDEPQLLEVIDLHKYFKIKTAGRYTLTVEARYFLGLEQRKYRPLILPKVSISFEVLASDLQSESNPR